MRDQLSSDALAKRSHGFGSTGIAALWRAREIRARCRAAAHG
jgi:hypothetical protein